LPAAGGIEGGAVERDALTVDRDHSGVEVPQVRVAQVQELGRGHAPILPDAACPSARSYRRAISVPGKNWGATPAEQAQAFPCDRHLADPDDAYFRAVSVDAPASVVFRWLCQLRLAPYSYDWIDNLGRRSPQTLVPGVDELAVGQRFAIIFRLVEFERDRHLTILLRNSPLFGDVAVTYLVMPETEERCRLIAKLLVRYPGPAPLAVLERALLPAGDLVMMRRQLLNLKGLAEASVSSPASRP
jgi:hypothetical protein